MKFNYHNYNLRKKMMKFVLIVWEFMNDVHSLLKNKQANECVSFYKWFTSKSLCLCTSNEHILNVMYKWFVWQIGVPVVLT